MEPKCFSELRVYWNDVSIRNSRVAIAISCELWSESELLQTLQQTCHLDEIWSLDSGDLSQMGDMAYTVNVLAK
ncbi:hypothetical protein E4U45_004134 [Claviceps purpurea]|nr:hypothetical protein E4U45_004134 [Claviceps purpurea]